MTRRAHKGGGLGVWTPPHLFPLLLTATVYFGLLLTPTHASLSAATYDLSTYDESDEQGASQAFTPPDPWAVICAHAPYQAGDLLPDGVFDTLVLEGFVSPEEVIRSEPINAKCAELGLP